MRDSTTVSAPKLGHWQANHNDWMLALHQPAWVAVDPSGGAAAVAVVVAVAVPSVAAPAGWD